MVVNFIIREYKKLINYLELPSYILTKLHVSFLFYVQDFPFQDKI